MKNPVLKRKYTEGFEAGKALGISKTNAFYIEKISSLETIHGIGPRTIEKIKKAIWGEYYK